MPIVPYRLLLCTIESSHKLNFIMKSSAIRPHVSKKDRHIPKKAEFHSDLIFHQFMQNTVITGQNPFGRMPWHVKEWQFCADKF